MITVRRPEGDNTVPATDVDINLHLFEYTNNIEGATGTVYFHKQIRNDSIYTNGYDLSEELQEAREETEELIY
jgi:FAD synthase